ncbi:Membrane protein involved in colicin uptake [Roseburia intestinalis XB6B4]|uniref:Membrane protein involved in colicin uptake n=2 Tax=Lachnospiraceae TaxID=186803 RepID=D4L4C2_9FIRM|nr:lysozyme family protein [Roseburia intestinalis]CBL14462.1 Membrane protein involved in colicin uptake [Roseburia intestinalis XB6B4]
MADIKTRDAVKGTIKTIDKAAVASERMKSAYAKTKDKAEQGYYADESSATEYAADRVSCASERVTEEGVHQFNKQGQKSIQTTQENIGKTKDKIADFKQKRAAKAAEQRMERNMSEQHGLQIRHGTASRSAAPDMPQSGKSQLIKTRQQSRKTIKTTARNAEKAVKSTAKGSVKTAERGVKTAQATSKATIKTAEQTAKATKEAAKASAKAAQKAAQAAKATAKATAEATKTAVRATIAAVKVIIAGTKALISALIAGGWVSVVIILIVVLLGCAVSLFGGGGGSNAYTPVSAEVEAYEPLIQKYAKQYGIPEYVELIKAVMMQESGGRGLDPMQAAEGSFNTRYPHEPNGIQDPEYSIQCGVQELKAALISAEVENPIDMEHIKLALQGYNFGNGYISWAKTNYGGYSYTNAVEFSTMQAQRLGWESYGDTQYPAHVLRYYPYGRAFTSGGNQAIVEVALTQLGNEGGQPYWSWYGFDGRVEWCACFVSWCADQCGYLDSGIVPKFAGCVDGANWFKGNGQWQDRNYEPTAGTIIFFDWENDGETDHVGIVEKCENGVVYTVEGNSGDACRQNQYSVGSSSIYGYGIPAY